MSINEVNKDGTEKNETPGKNKLKKSNSSKKSKSRKQNININLKKLHTSRNAQKISKTSFCPNSNKNIYQATLLINALNLHKSTIQSIWELSLKQNNLLKAKKFSKLFDSRHKKESLLQSLKKWGVEIKQYYENWNDWQDEISDKERNRLLVVTDNISSMVENVLSLEMENRILLEERKIELAKELGTISFFHDSLHSIFENRN